jgi:hypothetical protein
MDSSVYHLASALIGRRIGRMTPRSSMIFHRAHILLPGGWLPLRHEIPLK